MSNLSIKHNPNLGLLRGSEWEPMRWARDLLRWDPFREMTPAYVPDVATFAPLFDVKETKDAFVFIADVPGIAEKDLEITCIGNRLQVKGSRMVEKIDDKETHYVNERTYGTFTRIFTLPEGCDTDTVKAELAEGVLRIYLPKLPEAQPKKIAVGTNVYAKKS